MEKNMRAFFYHYRYYLFPDDCPSLDDLKQRGTVNCKRLKEENCMAPDFIYESIYDELLLIDAPDHLFEVSVNLYSAKEYDAILLERVKRTCPGCERFSTEEGAEEIPLDGHHRELPLNGPCYERTESGRIRGLFAGAAAEFWDEIAKHLNEFAECIDNKEQMRMRDILSDIMDEYFFIPHSLYGTVIGEHYCLCFDTTCGQDEVIDLICSYLAQVANSPISPIAQAGWYVIPYCPAGVLPLPEGDRYPQQAKVVSITPSEIPFRFYVTLYSVRGESLSDKGKQHAVIRFFHNLIFFAGGDVANVCIADFAFSNDRSHMVTVEEAARQMAEAYHDYVGNDFPADADTLPERDFPMPITYASREENAIHALPFREQILEGVTTCGKLSFLSREEEQDNGWMFLFSFAYLFFPRESAFGDDVSASDLDAVMWCLSHPEEVPTPLRDPLDSSLGMIRIGMALSLNGLSLDFAVANEDKMFRALRMLAPALRHCGAKVVLVNLNGITTYECGYEFIPKEMMAWEKKQHDE